MTARLRALAARTRRLRRSVARRLGARRAVAGLDAADRQAGVSTVEVVLLTPVLLLFVLFIVGLGMIVSAQSDTYGAARDAARAGSLQRDHAAALAQARRAAKADLEGSCAGGPRVSSVTGYHAGGMFTIEVSCDVSLSGLNLLGLGSASTVTGRASAPLDSHRRSQ